MLLEIAITLIMAKILNFLFEKYNQPGVVGEILAGIILGPCCLGYFSGTKINLFGTTLFEFNLNLNSTEFRELAFIGIVFLLFIIGLDTDIRDFKKSSISGFFSASFGIIVPFLFGFILGFIFHFDILACLGIGAILCASSVTICMRVLTDTGTLSSRVGLTLQAAGIISDIIGLFIFSLIIGQGHPILYILKMLIFVAFIIVVGYFIIKYTIKKGISKQTTMLVLPIGLISCFLFAAFAEDMGLAAIIGAFAAGLIIMKTPQGGMITSYIKTIAQTFFIPLFFVWIGASFNFFNFISKDQLLPQIFFISLFVTFGLLGNFTGASIGAKISGLKNKESLSVGAGMMPIMGMSLIIVSGEVDNGIFGYPSGLLAQQIKNATLLLIIISCLITPHLFKRSMRSTEIKKIKFGFKNKIRNYISEKITNKILYKSENNLFWKNECLLIKILVATIILQTFLKIIFGVNIYYTIISIIFSSVGSYFGYVTLRRILKKQFEFRYV